MTQDVKSCSTESEAATVCRSECIDHGRKGMGTGYANIRLPMSAGYGRHQALAHRFAYVQANGIRLEDIAGKVVRHRCDNPRCVNPKHLELGTHKDNTNDAVVRGRFVVGSRHVNAVLTEEQVRSIKASSSSSSVLAKQFGVGARTVRRIKSGEDWKHVE